MPLQSWPSRVPCTLLLLLAVACARAPIAWNAPATSFGASGDSLVVDSEGHARLMPAVPAAPPADSELDGSVCPGSVRVAAVGAGRVAVWWRPRADGSAALLLARTGAAGDSAWSAPVAIDSVDRLTIGCDRPPPTVAIHPLSGFVHVVYALESPAGPGLFYAHSMDGGRVFEQPRPIVYGERRALSAIALAGDTVAVVYEDPNSPRGDIRLALSFDQGHTFGPRLAASPDDARAGAPLVALRPPHIAVAWAVQAASANGSAQRAVRVGRVH